jgi:pimeloyl-ACP methyl ester carboxylesterase
MSRSDRFVTINDLEIHYSEWGASHTPPVVCVHGLSRVGRDFDPLARALEDEYRVLCPDMPGRGWSEWPSDAAAYSDEAMVGMLVGFCDTLDLDSFRWVGTSMGAGLGMALACGPLSDRITHLVVNDVSPDPHNDATEAALNRIETYAGDPPVRDTVTGLEAYYREVYGEHFSEMTDEEWQRFTVTSARRTDDGKVTRAYDPRILSALDENGDPSEEGPGPWDVWAAIEADILILHGRESGILPTAPYEQMLELQPSAETVEVDCGHAPALNVPAQTEPIREFFGSPSS